MDIKEGNKIISNFLGYEELDGAYWVTNTFVERMNWYYPRQMKFHSSWDWLMPVVEKIEYIDESKIGNEFQVVMYEQEISIFDKRVHPFKEIVNIPADGSSKIENTYKAVVEFIEWYNEIRHINK